MYYAGIYCDDHAGACWATVVEKVLRNAKKEYRVVDIRCFNMDSFVNEVKALYHDPRFLRKKKVFSQDRRPPKNTFTPPVLVVGVKSDDPFPVNSLRSAGIPVDGFYHRNEPGWLREELKVLRYGTNLHVHPSDLFKLSAVLESKAMLQVMEEGGAFAENLSKEICGFVEFIKHHGSLPEIIHGGLMGLMLALWHCETIRQIKRYGSG